MAEETTEEKNLEEQEPEGQEPEEKTEEEEEEGGEEPSKEVSKEDEDEEPPVRKSAKDYIIERKNKQLEKARQKEEEPEEDDDFAKKFDKEFERRFGTIQNRLREGADEAELSQVLSKYDDASRYEKKLRRYMTAYENVPVDSLYWMIKGQENAGAKSKADEEAKGTKTGGSTRRPGEKKTPNFEAMSDEEFLEWDRKQAQSQ